MSQTLLETVRVHSGTAPLWPLHLGRLTQSALALRIPLPDLEMPSGGADRVVRFEVGRSGVQVSERDVGGTSPIALLSSPVIHQGYPHKTTDRAWLEAARTTATALESDDALLFTSDGTMVEATLWAVGWWDNEALCFPPLVLNGLPSVARVRLGEMVRGGVREVSLRRGEVAKRALVACNAARGVVPVVAIDGIPSDANHRTFALAKRFWERPTAA